MPLFTTVRFFLSLISLGFWGAAGYLLGTWYQGEWVTQDYGALVRVRDDWRLWAALALIACGALGRFPVLALAARPSPRPERFDRGAGDMLKLADGAMVYLETRGEKGAPVIIFTHGQGLNSTVWSRIRRALLKQYRVVTWDLPGLGESSLQPARDYSVEHAAGVLREVVLSSASERVILVGHSFGGMVIQELAQADPEFFRRSVAGVVLMHTTHTNPLRTMVLAPAAQALQKPILEPGSKLTAWLEPLAWANNWQSYWSGAAHLANRMQFGPKVTRAQLEHTTLLATKNPPGVIERRNLAMYRWRGLQSGCAKVPALVIAGDADIVTKAQAGAQIVSIWREANLHLVEGANHLTPFERPEEYGKAISQFAGQVIASSRASEPAADVVALASRAAKPNGARPDYLH
jgi:pimeloyl-ACP methyl ester carboxylesterase